MRFIDQANLGKNDAFRYLLGVALIMLTYILGSTFIFLAKSILHPTLPLPETEIGFIDLFGKNTFLVLILIPFLLVFIGLYFIITKIHSRSFKSLITSRKSIDYKRIGYSFLILTIVNLLILGVQVYLNPKIVYQFDLQKFIPLAIISFLLIPIQTTCEELLFRGYIMQGLKLRSKSNQLAILVSGIMFGMVHIGNPEIAVIGYHIIVYYIAVGIFLGLISFFDDGMELAIGYHAANNLFAALFITTNWQVFQTDAVFIDFSSPSVGWDTIIGILIILPLLFIIFKRKYNWNFKIL